MKLKDDAKYMPQSECYTSSLQQGFFLNRRAVIFGPDTYINDVLITCSVTPKDKERPLMVI